MIAHQGAGLQTGMLTIFTGMQHLLPHHQHLFAPAQTTD